MNRYQKEMAQYNRRIPVYKYPVMFRLKESDRVKFEDRNGIRASIKQFLSAMGGVSLSEARKEYTVIESKLTDYIFYYDDPHETDEERKAIVLKEFNNGTTTIHHPMLKDLRKGIDYEYIVGPSEYVYQPRFNY